MDTKNHWEHVYTTKANDAVSWFQEHAETSLRFIRSATTNDTDAAIIDVGGGASKLVDELLAAGYSQLTVLDLSVAAMEASKSRLGNIADAVSWIEANITHIELPKNNFHIWHDRAVFHFLTKAKDRAVYIENLLSSLQPGGHVIISTFAENGPTQCSGLPVMRYSSQSLHAELGTRFVLVEEQLEKHETPFGTVQEFLYCHFTKS